jgi:hypothetical protein
MTLKLQVNRFVHSIIEKKNKFFSRKLDTLQKHISCHKAIVTTLMFLSMTSFTKKMHPITRMRGFIEVEEIFTQISHCQDAFGFTEKQSGSK